MRRLLVILAVLAALFTAYWFTVARGAESGIRAWFAARAAEGWVAEVAAVRTSGFPARFETVLTDLTLADPRTGVAWTAPRFVLEAAAFRPNRITARWPDRQTVASPWERIEVTSDRFDASIAFVPGTRLEVRAVEANLSDVTLTSTLGWETQFRVGALSAASPAAGSGAYEVRFEASDIVLPEALRGTLDPARLLPDVVEGMVVTADVTFDAPWDRFAVEVARPQVTALDLSDLTAQWGGIQMRAAGEVTVDAEGVPDGRITVKVTNWRDLLQVAGNAGLIPPPLMPTVERAFEVLAGLSGPRDTLDVPLTFANGVVSFGPLPLGPAPRIVIR
jgi:hypothetical protein